MERSEKEQKKFEYNKKWKKENPEKMCAARKRYALKHKDAIAARLKKYRSTPWGMYLHKKDEAKRRGILFNLSFEKFCEIKKLPCAFAGIDDNCRDMHKYDDTDTLHMTIDRLSNGVYKDDDVIPVCEYHNAMKNCMTPQAVKRLCELYQEKGVDERLWKI